MNTQSLDFEFKINKYATGYILTKCNSTKSIINIPSQHNGKPVISIGKRAFKECSLLRNIFLPSSIVYIGDSAFYGCCSLMCITIPNSVIYIEKNAFWGCSSLRSITISNNVKRISNYTFYGCSSLTNATIPNSITSIGKGAFRFCASLTTVVIPDSVTYIKASAFYGCSSLRTIYYTGTEEQWHNISIVFSHDRDEFDESTIFLSCDEFEKAKIIYNYVKDKFLGV